MLKARKRTSFRDTFSASDYIIKQKSFRKICYDCLFNYLDVLLSLTFWISTYNWNQNRLIINAGLRFRPVPTFSSYWYGYIGYIGKTAQIFICIFLPF